MEVAALSAASPLFPADEIGPLALPGAARPGDTAAGSFADFIGQQVSGVNGQLLTSQADLQQLASGEVQNLHQVMIRLEESRIAFQVMMQVRGRLLEAYQDILRMQV
jgi:flagellar hook-basal body complex protein FliE